MPSTVADIVAAARLEPDGVVAWGTPVPCAQAGVYIVALVDDPRSMASTLARAPLDLGRIQRLLDARPELRLDGGPATAALVAERLAGFWIPDEVALYVGCCGQPLRKRVRQYYRTPLGARRPHAGGWWLKTLAVLDMLWVHYAATPDFRQAEGAMLTAFADQVSMASRAALHDSERLAPFANLRTGTDAVKRHGISGATGDVAPGGEHG